MNEIDTLINLDVWGIVRWFYLIGLGLYFVFALIVWRQIDLMVRTLNGSLQLPIRLLGVGLVVVSGLVMIVAMMIL